MKRTVLFSLYAIALLALSAPALLAQGPKSGDDALTLRARAFIAALAKGDFAQAALDFDATMAKVSGPDKLEALWTKHLPAQLGPFGKQGAARRERMQDYEIVLVTCSFAKSDIDVRVVFDKAGKIAGFGLVPTAPEAKYEPPAYADPARFEEREVTVGSGEWALPGTLTAPKGAGPFPGLVLVHGSGANDRDEALGPNKPFKDLAWGLASRGVAVLRYDKRSKVHGKKIVADPKLEATMTVKDETVDDAVAAAALLQRTAGIDPKRVFILGHSLGGYLLPRLALAAEPLGVAGYISMAGLTRPLDETILRQMDFIRMLSGAAASSEAEMKKIRDIEAAVARIRALTDADRGSTVKILGAMPAYWLDLSGYDPPALAKTVKRPMLFLQGGRDYQVQTVDLENWKKALEPRPDVAFKLYPRLNHLFFAGEGLITPLEYVQKHGSVAEEVVADIAAWMSKR
jgi:dienelactone hydrolase